MRLLHTSKIKLKFFADDEIPDYVILSHRWEKEEVTFQHLLDGSAHSKDGWSKIVETCAQAAKDGYDWVWIDCCCINKSSSAELSEAINSMWNWYRRANVCYAFLSDVEAPTADKSAFLKSQWWTRGWTLQELLAPSLLEFYSKDWQLLGTRVSKIQEIVDFTGISTNALALGLFSECNAAEKMSWMRHRECTRKEDIAYCLLGLFNVNMPLLYGEGATKAFLRLQTEILRRDADETLYLYARCPADTHTGLLAEQPWQFCRKEECLSCGPEGVISCLDPSVDYESLEVVATGGVFDTVNDDITVSSEGVRGTFRVLSADFITKKLARPKPAEVSETLLLNILSSPEMVFAIPVGRKEHVLSPGDVALYRLTRPPAVISAKKVSFKPRRLKISDPWWLTQKNQMQLVWSSGSEHLKIVGSIDRRRSTEVTTVVRREDQRIVLTSSDPSELKCFGWVVQSDFYQCTLLFSALVIRSKDATTCMMLIRELSGSEAAKMAADRRVMVADDWNWNDEPDMEHMTSAEHGVLKLRDGRKLEFKTQRRPASRGTNASTTSSLNYQFAITRMGW